MQNVVDIGLHSDCAGLLHLVGHVAINIQSKSCGSMAKVTLNSLDVIPGTQRSNSITVPEIMKSCIRPANGCDDFFEMPHHGLRNQISTQLICKNQIQRIGPSGSCF